MTTLSDDFKQLLSDRKFIDELFEFEVITGTAYRRIVVATNQTDAAIKSFQERPPRHVGLFVKVRAINIRHRPIRTWVYISSEEILRRANYRIKS